MSKYNANGDQRRSSSKNINLPLADAIVKCRLCPEKINRLNFVGLKQWEMQHMHFSDGELEFMTCPKCKTINPMKMLEMLGESHRLGGP